MLEVTPDDIAALNDVDLRSLVGMLCEAELRSSGMSTAFVTWGGNQNAGDGGIDVRVAIQGDHVPGGYIPRLNVGFQVKSSNYTAASITEEMRPNGRLRNSIVELIGQGGGYIIASSGSHTSDSMLAERTDAMRQAVSDQPLNEELLVDFYDRTRLASWAKSHAGIVAWVRKKAGREIQGWQPYGAWALSPNGVEDDYILDDTTRIRMVTGNDRELDVLSGIERMREILRGPRGIIRLVGLSGVGKTRLAQSLFDSRIGAHPLGTELAIYTDLSDSPSPHPSGMISGLIATGTRAIVVIDNCAPDLHRRLAELCLAPNSIVSLITIEYDVQDDEPEGTQAVRLEPSSPLLLVDLLARRFPEMSDADIKRAAEFSGGNARIALNLANTWQRGESWTGLRDEDLFRRLIFQRQGEDTNLLKAAQACALLYSFDGESLSEDEAELPKIAALVEMSVTDVFGYVAKLKQRDLIQRRDRWRAVLPQAIANRLASSALREIPAQRIEAEFNTSRLLKSFSKRLGYLHDHEEAQRIVERWLSEQGLLSRVENLSGDILAIFDHIAPVSPVATLASIERALLSPSAHGITSDERIRNRIGILLYLLAYDPELFYRAVVGLASLVVAERSDGHQQKTLEELFTRLFYILYSGTHATVEQRVEVVQELIGSHDTDRRLIGLLGLEALLKADLFRPSHLSDFGSRNRDYGFTPTTDVEQMHWFVTTLTLARQHVLNHAIGYIVRSHVAECLLSVWSLGLGVQDEFEKIADEIGKEGYWSEGWLASRAALSNRTDQIDQQDSTVERLRRFEARLRPRDLAERVRAVVLGPPAGAIDYADFGHSNDNPDTLMERLKDVSAQAEELGKAVCQDDAAFNCLLPDIVKGGPGRLFVFGRGLAFASADHRRDWNKLIDAFGATSQGARNSDVIAGFLHGLANTNAALCETMLDEAVTHTILSPYFPTLQSQMPLTSRGIGRIRNSITDGRSQPGAYFFLRWATCSPGVRQSELRDLVSLLSHHSNGYRVAVEIVSSRIKSSSEQAQDNPLHEWIDAGRELLSEFVLSSQDPSSDYHLHEIANECLLGEDGAEATRALCERIRQGIIDHVFYLFGVDQVLGTIFSLQPRIALDTFFDRDSMDDQLQVIVRAFRDLSARRQHPLQRVSSDEMVSWCEENAAIRYAILSRIVPFDMVGTNGREWTPLSVEMLMRAPNPTAILEQFVRRFTPQSWSGSLAAILESRIVLLDQISAIGGEALIAQAEQFRTQLLASISGLKESEERSDRLSDERFE